MEFVLLLLMGDPPNAVEEVSIGGESFQDVRTDRIFVKNAMGLEGVDAGFGNLWFAS